LNVSKSLLNILEEIILEVRMANHYLKWIFGVVTKESWLICLERQIDLKHGIDIEFQVCGSSLEFRKVYRNIITGKWKIRVNLIQARSYIDVGSVNLKKKEILKNLCRNYKLYESYEFFEMLYKVVGWKFD
jgi:hypothetical protein